MDVAGRKGQKSRDGSFAQRIFRFGTVGFLNTAVDFGILNLLMFFLRAEGASLIVCNVVAFGAASLNSYLWNKRWTFEERSRGSVGQYLLFLLFSVGGLAINCLVLYLLTIHFLAGIGLAPILQINLAKASATLASMTWNYVAYRQIVFRRPVYRYRQPA